MVEVMDRKLSWWISFVLIVLLWVTSESLWSQTTYATITGNVKDQSGAIVPETKVVVTNLETGIQTSTKSNDVGNFTIPQLREGAYSLTASASGFGEFKVENVILASRDIRRVDVTLTVGNVQSKVEVREGITLIETDTARIASTMSADALKNAPMNARWISSYLNLMPNFNREGGTYRFAGSRSNQSNWSIDGTSVNDGFTGSFVGPQQNYMESFQELKVDMANNSAEFGSMGQVTLISKSGSNELHGSLFDYYQTPAFVARNPFALQKTGTQVRHFYGGSLSGPVIIPKLYNGRNRTFFFGSLESSIGSDQRQLLDPTVPTEAWRRGDFSNLSTDIIDPSTGKPFEGNIIPANRINPVSKAIQDRFYPLPNMPDSFTNRNYQEVKSRPWDSPPYWVVRVDHRFSDSDFVYGRYTATEGPNTPYEGNLPTIGRRTQNRATKSASFSYTHLFSHTLVNEFRYGLVRNNNPFWGPVNGLELVNELGLRGLAPDVPDIPGILNITWPDSAIEDIRQIQYNNPGYRNSSNEFQNQLSWFKGRHNLKFGFNLLNAQWENFEAPSNLFGQLSFTNRFTGNAYADFLLGIPTTTSRAFNPKTLNLTRWQYDFFVADDFKVNSKLTLSLGMRYELHPYWREKNDLISTFDPGTASIVVPDGAMDQISPFFPQNYVNIVPASSIGLPKHRLIFTDTNNFAPRIGVAYRPWGDRTVFRAGYGIYYDLVPRTTSFGTSPFIVSEPAYTNPKSNPNVLLPNIWPAQGSGAVTSIALPDAVNPHLRIPYSMQYSFTIEREQWGTGFRASYIGTNTRQGDYKYNINSPVPDGRPYNKKPRPFPNYPGINYYTNGAGHQYNALTIEARRPTVTKGIMFDASWTWARDIYDLNQGEAPENPFDRSRDRGVNTSVPTHLLIVNTTFQLPFGKGRTWLSNASKLVDLFLGGWNINVIYRAQTGQFLTPLWSGPDPTGTVYTSSDTPANVTLRPDIHGDPNLPADERSVNRWFDSGVFSAPAPGRFGTAAKGVIKGPGMNSWNAGVAKNFRLTERLNFRWEMQATNVFNHPNWGNPKLSISTPSNVGMITSLGSGESSWQRNLQMAMRLEW